MAKRSETEQPAKQIHISIDPRIELLSIVLKFSGYGDLYGGRISDTPSSYLRNAEQHFGSYSNHESIRYFRNINGRIAGDLPVAIVLYASEPPALEWRTPVDDTIRARVEDEQVPGHYVQALRHFARDSGFAEFFAAHQDYYRSILVLPESFIEQVDFTNRLEEYFGTPPHGYFVIFAPLLKTVAFGPRVRWPNGDLDTYCVFPSVGVENDLILFKEGRALQNRVLHEFAHSFVNPVVDRFREELARYAFLVRAIRYKTGANYGTDWNICLYEHLVRAVTARLTCRELGEEAGEKEMLAHEGQGFIYLRELASKLLEYEQARKRYPTFEDFFPELMDVFERLSQNAKRP